jgi:hypothetical protein
MKLYEMFGNEQIPIEDMASTSPTKIIKDEQGKYEFDLAEDLVFFMHNNDDFYRRHFFPILKTCKAQYESGNELSHRVFKKVIEKAYDEYKKEFPVKELDDNLEEDFKEQVAHHIYETEIQNIKDGFYK